VNCRNTIIAGNTGAFRDFAGSLTSQGYNLIGNNAGTTITGDTTGNIVGTGASPVNALLGPLEDNGGPTKTKTIALLPGSPALDAGTNCVLTNNCASNNLGFNLTLDQRGMGFDRLVGSAVDIGALEVEPPTHLAFGVQPASGVAHTTFAVTVQVLDAANNLVTTPTRTINLAFGNNPAAATLSGTTSVAAVSGIATFNNLTVNLPGSGYTLAASSGGLTDVTSDAFNATVNPTCMMNPVVTNNADGGPGSLRQVVADACAGSTITFNVTGIIRLQTNIPLTRNLTIQGPGADVMTIQNIAARSATSRIFHVMPGVTTTISGLKITGGYVLEADGGGIYNEGNLTVKDSRIHYNRVTNRSGFFGFFHGAGIFNNLGAVLTVTDSTISNNYAIAGRGGGIFNALGTVTVNRSIIRSNFAVFEGGGICNQGSFGVGEVTVTDSTIAFNVSSNSGPNGAGLSNNGGTLMLINSTVSTNVASVSDLASGSLPQGGGIANHAGGTLTLINSTITNNQTPGEGSKPVFGGGIANIGGTVNSRNSIIAGNTGLSPDFFGSLTSQGYNLIGNNLATTITGDTTGNIVGTNAAPVDPRLAQIGFYGGPTMTNPLLSDSPAINAGNTATSPTADQRGAARVGTADIGAFELNNPANGGNYVATLPDGRTGIPYSYYLIPYRGADGAGQGGQAWTYSMSGGALPSGISLSTNGTLVSIDGTTNQSGLFNFTVTGTDGVNSIVTDYRVQFLAPTDNNTAPGMMQAAAILRQQGSAAGAAMTVGTVSDAETAAGSLTVTQIAGGTATGITISGITNTGGTITALLSAACNATAGTVRFQVSDGSLSGTGDLQVDVSANSAPTLTYAVAAVNGGGATTNSPTTATDNGSIASYAVQSQGTYTGTISVNSSGLVSISNAALAGDHTIMIRATDNCGATKDATFTLTVNNNTPTITAGAALTRQRGTAGSVSTIATVSDTETAAASLIVTATTVPAGLTIPSITNNSGTLTANVAASCAATIGANTVVLTVTDGNSGANTANLTVSVTANTAPTLTYAAASVNAGASTTNSPTTATDNGSITSYAVQSQGTYTGTISVNAAGMVSISNAAPVGSHTITIRATDNCGATKDATFTLTVNSTNTAPTFTPAAALGRQQGSAAGAAVTIGTVSDGQTAAGSLTVTQIAGGTATGISVTGIANTGGTITAQVSAACAATSGTVRFQVSDGSLTGTGDLQVNVTANSAPTMGSYPNTLIAPGGTTLVTPAVAPADNGSIVSITATATPNFFIGTLTGNTATGALMITNANPVGGYNIIVTVTDNCGATTTKSFMLTVSSCGASLSKTGQNFAANGGTGTFTVTIDGACPWTAVSNAPSFITIVSPTGQMAGSGTVSFTVGSHTNTAPRSGTISVAGQTFTVRQGAQFGDVPGGAPLYEEIGKLSAVGITLGCVSGNYCPESSVTREQMAIFIVRALGDFNPPTPATATFEDVPNSGPTEFSHEFVEKLVSLGITSGCQASPRLYCPTSNVTREQMAIFVVRALGFFNPPTPATATFADVPNSEPTEFSHEFVEKFVELGITSGCAAGPPRLYCPTAPVTRRQMAVFLVRAFNL
jgi:hypothetical protein